MQKTSAHTLEYLIRQEEMTVRQFTAFAEAAESRGALYDAIDARDCVGLANQNIEELKRKINERNANNH